jgi:hypothetical protein
LVGSAGALGPAGAVTLAALLAVEVAVVGALGAAGDRPGAGGGLAAWLLVCSSTTTRAPRAA